MAQDRELRVRCAIAGGGPAGIVLGFLLARAGLEVAVLEKHRDFLRDFRGDTIHPSTLTVLAELGLLDEFLALPHQELRDLAARIGDTAFPIADLRHVPGPCKFIALMPQWDFLNFLSERARRYPGFHLVMEGDVKSLVYEDARVCGLRADTPDGPLSVGAELVVAADGRSSTLRAAAALAVEEIGAPMDVLWMRLPRNDADPRDALGVVSSGEILVLIPRGDFYQCGLVIAKGGFDAVRARGLAAFRDQLSALAPFLAGRVQALAEWDDVKLLTVAVDRLSRWYAPGLLCIGDAAHAMSPIGGVGINLAVQDAVAAANLLVGPLRAGAPALADLRAVQQRRALPTRLTQMLQVAIQNRIVRGVLGATAPISPPWPLRLLAALPMLRRVPAYVVGIGFRPEHVRTSAIS